MHFGKIVKEVALANGVSAEELGVLLGRPCSEILLMYEQEEWTSTNIKCASVALEYDLGKFLNDGYAYTFLPAKESSLREFLLTIKYPAGKKYLMQSWLSKMKLIARAIGLEAD